LGQRDLAGARRQLVAAERVAQSQPDLDRVTRLETMVNVLEEFWKGMREAVASLDAGVELKVGETYVAVVESSRDRLLIKTAGRLRSWAVEDLPSVLVLSVAEEFFREDAVKKLLIGAFLAVDPKGDRAKARRLWQEAARGQTGVDVKQLLLELDAAPAGASNSSASRGQPPPSGAELQAAEQAVRARFAQQLAGMHTPADRLTVAQGLLSAAAAEQDQARRFVMLRKAMELAVAAGDVEGALEAVQRLSETFAIDAFEARLSALEQIERNARTLSIHRDVAFETLKLLQQALKQKDANAARRLSKLAVAAARGSRNVRLMQQAVQLEKAAQALGGG